MRIVHISTHDALGGAARAALRLHQALLAAGEASTMVVRWKVSTLESVVAVPVPETRPSWWGQLAQTWYIDRNRSPMSSTFYSLDWPGHDLSSHPAVQAADVIHLHWISCFQSPATVAALLNLGKPVAWTLHDQRAFTGGCHFSAACTKYESDCARCPQLETDPASLAAGNLAEQLRCYVAGAPCCLVAPSRWMAECAGRSALFRHLPIEVVPNGVDTQVFRPVPRAEARQELGLPADGLLLAFGADDLAERRKGFGELVQALGLCLQDPGFQRLAAAGQIGLLLFGKAGPELARLNLPTRSLGQVSSEETLRAAYGAANAFILPSLEDNLPNTALEALSCGTPVLGFRTGGIPELVIEDRTGHLVPAGDVQALSRMLCSLATQPAQLDRLAAGCRHHIEAGFTLARQAERCLRLYRLLLQPRSSAPPPASTGAPRPDCAAFAPSLARALTWVAEARSDIFDAVDTGAEKPEEVRVLHERGRRLVMEQLAEGAAGRLACEQLVARLDAALASIQRTRDSLTTGLAVPDPG